MKLNLIERNKLDVERWNDLVSATPNVSFFSFAWYLDEVAEQWCVFVDDNYTSGIAIPYTVRFRKKIAYTPIFASYMEVVGNRELDKNQLKSQVIAHFPIIELCLKTNALGVPTQQYVTQLIPADEIQQLSSQAKRMLKKARAKGLEIRASTDFESIFRWVEQELKGKFTGMTDESLPRLKQLFTQSEQRGQLIAFEVWKDAKCRGGIVCLENEGQMFYLKGACGEEAKKNGGMYLALQKAIETAQSKGKLFDFGGSRVDGVQAFNKNLGGMDLFYNFYKIDNSPVWFKWLRMINSRIKNR